MEHSKKLAHATLAGILSLAAVHDDALAQADAQVKCYGVAAANKNACGTTYSACAGQISVPKACYAWTTTKDAATCMKQAGSVNHAALGCVEPNPNAPTSPATSAASVTPAAPTASATDKSESWSFASLIKKWF